MEAPGSGGSSSSPPISSLGVGTSPLLAAKQADEPVPEQLERQPNRRRHADDGREEHAAGPGIEVGVRRGSDQQAGHESEQENPPDRHRLGSTIVMSTRIATRNQGPGGAVSYPKGVGARRITLDIGREALSLVGIVALAVIPGRPAVIGNVE